MKYKEVIIIKKKQTKTELVKQQKEEFYDANVEALGLLTKMIAKYIKNAKIFFNTTDNTFYYESYTDGSLLFSSGKLRTEIQIKNEYLYDYGFKNRNPERLTILTWEGYAELSSEEKRKYPKIIANYVYTALRFMTDVSYTLEGCQIYWINTKLDIDQIVTKYIRENLYDCVPSIYWEDTKQWGYPDKIFCITDILTPRVPYNTEVYIKYIEFLKDTTKLMNICDSHMDEPENSPWYGNDNTIDVMDLPGKDSKFIKQYYEKYH